MSAGLEEQVLSAQEEHEAAEREGRSIEEIADDPESTVEEPIPPMQIPLEGLGSTITATPGGLRPSTSSVVLRGGKLAVEGEFKKGDVVELYVRCRVGDVSYPDTHDKYGEAISCERKHVLRPIAVRRLAASEVESTQD